MMCQASDEEANDEAFDKEESICSVDIVAVVVMEMSLPEGRDGEEEEEGEEEELGG